MVSSVPSPLAGQPAHPTLGAQRWTRAVNWFVEGRSHRVICLLLGIWLLNAFDLAFTVLAQQQGMLVEQNPIAREVLNLGPVSVMLFKVGLVLIGTYPLLRFRTARIAELAAVTVLVAYASLAIHWAECIELYTLTLSSPVSLTDIEMAGQLNPH